MPARQFRKQRFAGASQAAWISRLDEASAGERVWVARVFERDRQLLEYLDAAGMRPGVALDVVEPHDGAMVLRTAGRQVDVNHPAAAKVWVRRHTENCPLNVCGAGCRAC